MKKIKVRCLEGFIMRKKNVICAKAVKGKIYTAILCENSGEYFAKDNNGHEFLVGELDMDENLRLDKDFELVE